MARLGGQAVLIGAVFVAGAAGGVAILKLTSTPDEAEARDEEDRVAEVDALGDGGVAKAEIARDEDAGVRVVERREVEPREDGGVPVAELLARLEQEYQDQLEQEVLARWEAADAAWPEADEDEEGVSALARAETAGDVPPAPEADDMGAPEEEAETLAHRGEDEERAFEPDADELPAPAHAVLEPARPAEADTATGPAPAPPREASRVAVRRESTVTTHVTPFVPVFLVPPQVMSLASGGMPAPQAAHGFPQGSFIHYQSGGTGVWAQWLGAALEHRMRESMVPRPWHPAVGR